MPSIPKPLIFILAAALSACTKAPPAPPALPSGTWVIHTKSAITAPEKLPELMGSYFDTHVLVSVAAGKDGPVLRLDSAEASGAPMGCGITTEVPMVLGEDGQFTAQLGVIPLVGEDDLPYTLADARIAGQLGGGGVSFSSVTGAIDSAAFVSLLGASEPGALCQMVGENVPCGACPDGAETCWDVALAPVLEEAPPLAVRTAEEVCAEPSCADRPWCGGD